MFDTFFPSPALKAGGYLIASVSSNNNPINNKRPSVALLPQYQITILTVYAVDALILVRVGFYFFERSLGQILFELCIELGFAAKIN